MKVHTRVESSGQSFNTMGMAIVLILVSNETVRLEFEGQILLSKFINACGTGGWCVAEFTGSSCNLQG